VVLAKDCKMSANPNLASPACGLTGVMFDPRQHTAFAQWMRSVLKSLPAEDQLLLRLNLCWRARIQKAEMFETESVYLHFVPLDASEEAGEGRKKERGGSQQVIFDVEFAQVEVADKGLAQ